MLCTLCKISLRCTQVISKNGILTSKHEKFNEKIWFTKEVEVCDLNIILLLMVQVEVGIYNRTHPHNPS